MGAAPEIWLGVLGPLDLRVDGVVLPVTARRQRALLGTLLVRANEIVSFEELADIVWDGSPPRTARETVRNYVKRLRGGLGSALADRIVTRDPGYLFRVAEGELDRLTFAGLCGAGQVAVRAGDWQRASDQFGRALALWRGPALVDVSAEALHREEVPRLERLRLQAVEGRIDAEMRLGRHDLLVDELRDLLVRYPLHERLHAQLMLALARGGRRAEAMEAYRRARRAIVDELGIEPDGDLRDLHQRILRADPGLSAPDGDRPAADRPERATSAGPTDPAVDVPHQLPAPVKHFTGRAEQVAFLSGLAGGVTDPPAVVLSAVDGMAGIGKTALAVHAAHRLVGHYPDGQLFVDLHGFTDGAAPVDPGAALAGMLRALGVAGDQIPTGVDERAALYRSRLAGRRMLLVLDNAASEAQVRPLLPGAAGCLVLITSRQRLAGLDDVEPLSLDVLPVRDAVALFSRTVGPGRLGGVDAALLREIVELCGRLPLAIRIAAARLRHRPGWTPAGLADLLRDRPGRLAALRAGERSVAASVHLSYTDLGAEQRRMFRLLGLHPGADTDSRAAAALAGCAEPRAGRILEDLCDVHLLDQPIPGRYRLHDLIRAHANDLAHAEESEADRREALGRLFDHYTRTAIEAVQVHYPHEAGLLKVLPRPLPRPAAVPRYEPAGAARWLDDELDNMLAVASHAAGDWPAHTVTLSAALHPHLDARARYTDAEDLHRAALGAARFGGDRHGELTALIGLGHAQYRQGRQTSADWLGRALLVARDLGDRHGEMLALVGLAQVHHQRARHRQATDCLERARSIAGGVSDPSGEIRVLLVLGNVHLAQGRYEEAASCLERARTVAAAIGHRTGELAALTGLGRLHLVQKTDERGVSYLERALRISGEIGDRTGELNALLSLGRTHTALGRYERGVDCLERAMRIAVATGHRNGMLVALTGLGLSHHQRGRNQEAAACYQRALPVARDLGVPISEILTLTGLGHARRAQGAHQEALHCFDTALRIAERIGYRNGQFEALHGFGRTSHETGCPDRAVGEHQAALDLAVDLDQPADQARAHDGLAHAHRALGDPDRARWHWQRALDILTGLSLARADDVSAADIRAHLASPAPGG